MVKHDIQVRGVGIDGSEQKPPVLLQMNDDAFPARFLQDLTAQQNSLSNATIATDTLYQPVQRILHVAMADLKCNTLMYPRLDPKRVISAGVLIRRCYRWPGLNGSAPYDDPDKLSGWMRSPDGTTRWVVLSQDQENLDPDPSKRKQVRTGQAALDAQLAQLKLSVALTEATSPAFAAPPATCASLGRTVFYGVVPTASSEVSDTAPASPPNTDRAGLISALPPFLRSSQGGSPPKAPAPGASVDYRWMSDDFLNQVFPPVMSAATSSGTPPLPSTNPQAQSFQMFSLALRMLQSVFSAFDGSTNGSQILAILNKYNVTFAPPASPSTQRMGDFFQSAKAALIDYNPQTSSTQPAITMPSSWDGLSNADETALVTAMITALTPQSQKLLAPQGRYQDSTRLYRLRFFFRVKSEMPSCPPELVWSRYSAPFRIAAWFEGGQRAHPPVPLPDPANFGNMKPNCSFQVPTNLMNAMQGSTLSGLMNGSGGSGGGGPSLGWICGFNIPLITICAFFVLNIFLMLLNIVFFWLPFIKICIPFPNVSSSSPDEGTP